MPESSANVYTLVSFPRGGVSAPHISKATNSSQHPMQPVQVQRAASESRAKQLKNVYTPDTTGSSLASGVAVAKGHAVEEVAVRADSQRLPEQVGSCSTHSFLFEVWAQAAQQKRPGRFQISPAPARKGRI